MGQVSGQKTGWQPIETAPRDGSAMLFYLESELLHSRVAVGFIHPNVMVVGGLLSFYAPKATHWMPLPEPPKEGE